MGAKLAKRFVQNSQFVTSLTNMGFGFQKLITINALAAVYALESAPIKPLFLAIKKCP